MWKNILSYKKIIFKVIENIINGQQFTLNSLSGGKDWESVSYISGNNRLSTNNSICKYSNYVDVSNNNIVTSSIENLNYKKKSIQVTLKDFINQGVWINTGTDAQIYIYGGWYEEFFLGVEIEPFDIYAFGGIVGTVNNDTIDYTQYNHYTYDPNGDMHWDGADIYIIYSTSISRKDMDYSTMGETTVLIQGVLMDTSYFPKKFETIYVIIEYYTSDDGYASQASDLTFLAWEGSETITLKEE
jgi:hypothetical protein